MLALLAACAVAAFNPDGCYVAVDRDEIRDVTTIIASLGVPIVRLDRAVAVAFAFPWQGVDRDPARATDTVYMRVAANANSWTFLKQNDAVILADETRLHPRLIDKDVDFAFARGGGLTEVLAYKLTVADLRTIAKASHVAMAVGNERWEFTQKQIDTLESLATLLSVSGSAAKSAIEIVAAKERAEAEAAEAERRAKAEAAEAERRAKAEAAEAKVRASRDEVQAAIDKARAAYRALPKRKQKIFGEEVRWRTFNRELAEIRDKYDISDADVEKALRPHRDFAAKHFTRIGNDRRQ